MSQLRSLRMGAKNNSISQITRSIDIGHNVELNTLMAQSNHAGAVLHKDPLVVFSRLGSGLDEHLTKINSEPKLSDENGAILKNGSREKDETVNQNRLGDQPVDGGMVLQSPVVDHRLEDGKCVSKIGADLSSVHNARQLVTSEKVETIRPAGQRPKSYLKIYKENYRASKKKLSSQASASDGDLWRTQEAPLEGRYMTTVKV
ncbi:hypothetical protein RSOLAG22IIIB_11959 [Rhizoctonia solani]|uniref:Uncharacterized protein n=1 Tax=Rhizoctonia solani TaxID=456999 RepID=A0A0K6GB97_9AGAM|nr:hypothetical protein RSOLAG22IIIB_11959 [Rhizoctonia solani]